jgi:hypothetical protein
VSCLVLPGESLLSIERIKRLLSFREKKEKERRQGQWQGRGRGKASLDCVMFSLAPGVSPL